MSALANRFSQVVHPALPPLRASFAQAAHPSFSFGDRIFKTLSRLLLGAFSSANRGYVTFLGHDLKDGQFNRTCHLRHG